MEDGSGRPVGGNHAMRRDNPEPFPVHPPRAHGHPALWRCPAKSRPPCRSPVGTPALSGDTMARKTPGTRYPQVGTLTIDQEKIRCRLKTRNEHIASSLYSPAENLI